MKEDTEKQLVFSARVQAALPSEYRGTKVDAESLKNACEELGNRRVFLAVISTAGIVFATPLLEGLGGIVIGSLYFLPTAAATVKMTVTGTRLHQAFEDNKPVDDIALAKTVVRSRMRAAKCARTHRPFHWL